MPQKVKADQNIDEESKQVPAHDIKRVPSLPSQLISKSGSSLLSSLDNSQKLDAFQEKMKELVD